MSLVCDLFTMYTVHVSATILMYHDFYLSNYNFTIGCPGCMEIITIVLVEGTRSIGLNNEQAHVVAYLCTDVFFQPL
jgi:hypothetical protein